MLKLDELALFDGLIWLRTGESVARRFSCAQSTVSRNTAKVLELFGLELVRDDFGEWQLLGDLSLLNAERQVHQKARWASWAPLRLEATYWTALSYCAAELGPWMLGNSDIMSIRHRHLLLDHRIVDCQITTLPDLLGPIDPRYCYLQLTAMQPFFVCAPDHPLTKLKNPSFDDLAAYPSLALPAQTFPKVEAALKQLGLWDTPVRMHRYRYEKWEGKCESELLISYGNPLTQHTAPNPLHRLPLALPFASGDVLVYRQDFEGHPLLLALIERLSLAVDAVREIVPGITKVFAPLDAAALEVPVRR